MTQSIAFLDRTLCRFLRSKGLHVYGQRHADAFVTSRYAGYQCLRTQFVTGPDGLPCVPEGCGPHRECFESR